MTPFDVVKVRMQVQTTEPSQRSCFIYRNGLMDHICQIQPDGKCITHNSKVVLPEKPWYARLGKYTNTWDAFTKIARAEGISSLWSGLAPTLVMSVPANVAYFTMYDILKYKLGFRENDQSTKYVPVVAGSVARSISTTLVTPLELIRTKLQSERMSYKDLGRTVRNAVEAGGIMSLMQGLGPTLLRDIPFSAVYWFTYEELKAVQLGQEAAEPSLHQSFYAGALAGALAAVLTHPFDIIKTQRQTALGSLDSDVKVLSTWLTTKKLYNSGWRHLFSGLFPRLLRIAPACAIMISSYEYGKIFFQNYNSNYHIKKT